MLSMYTLYQQYCPLRLGTVHSHKSSFSFNKGFAFACLQKIASPIFSVRTWSFLCVFYIRGLGTPTGVSTTCLTRKKTLTSVSCASDGVRTSGLWISRESHALPTEPPPSSNKLSIYMRLMFTQRSVLQWSFTQFHTFICAAVPYFISWNRRLNVACERVWNQPIISVH